MVKSGLIVGAGTLVLVLGAALFSPFCSLCVALLAGLLAGYLAGVFDKPVDSSQSLRLGAIAGAIAGVLGLLGQGIGSVINGFVLSSGGSEAIYELLGMPSPDPQTIWMSQIGIACCMGLVNIALMAGLGAGGGAIWFQTAGKK
jgi:hypothetical protein